MAPGIVFRCLLCKRILKTVKGLEEHHRKIHGINEVTSEHYKLLFLKNPPVVNVTSGASAVIPVSSGKVKVEGGARGRLDGDSRGPGGGGAGPSGSRKGVFKTPVLPPKSTTSEEKLPPIVKFENKTIEPSLSVSPPSNLRELPGQGVRGEDTQFTFMHLQHITGGIPDRWIKLPDPSPVATSCLAQDWQGQPLVQDG